MFWIWVGVAAGVPLLAVIVIYVIGRSLPETYETESKWRFPCPADQIWDAMLDYHSMPLAGSMARKVEDLPTTGRLPRWREDLGRTAQTVQVEVADRPRRLVLRAKDEKLPMEMVFTVNFDLRDNATRVLARRKIRLEDGTWHVPFFRFLMHYFKVHQKGQRLYLLQLARKLGVESEFAI